MKNKFIYSGSELDTFELAKNWKKYYLDLCKDNFSQELNVLEVGAGIGGLSSILIPQLKFKTWTLLEPDDLNFRKLEIKFSDSLQKNKLRFLHKKIEEFLKFQKNYDIILLADVLEHLYDDKKILLKLFNMLSCKGKIIIFVPAHQFIYSNFDKQIGHYRRYNFKMLKQILPRKGNIKYFKYIDSLGFFASLSNKFFLKSHNPSLSQILFWDRVIIPLSRIIDKLIRYKFGKNIYLTIYR